LESKSSLTVYYFSDTVWFNSAVMVTVTVSAPQWTVRRLIAVDGEALLSSYWPVLATPSDLATSGDFPISSTKTAEVLTVQWCRCLGL